MKDLRDLKDLTIQVMKKSDHQLQGKTVELKRAFPRGEGNRDPKGRDPNRQQGGGGRDRGGNDRGGGMGSMSNFGGQQGGRGGQGGMDMQGMGGGMGGDFNPQMMAQMYQMMVRPKPLSNRNSVDRCV